MKGVLGFLKLLVIALLYWMVAIFLFYIFRYFGLGEQPGIIIESHIFPTDYRAPLLALASGVVLGLVFASVETMMEALFFKKKSIGFVILFKSLIYLGILIVVSKVMAVWVNNLLGGAMPVKGAILTKKFFWAFAVFFGVATVFFSVLKILSDKFGRGNMLKLLLGKYRRPKEEKRIFMFLDLRSSTALAEKLGHFKYSRLIQQCFYDLNDVIRKYRGEIYQYVGDEAVISWPYRRGIKDNSCLKCFFAFQKRIKDREEAYRREFGLVPEFKAGLHGGKLIVTEVGIIKKEIAYHGDVINTTSRIQESCNTFKETLLVSEMLISELNIDGLKTRKLGEIKLKGKKEPVSVMAVSI